MSAFHIEELGLTHGSSSRLQLLVNIGPESSHDGSGNWVPTTHMGDLDCMPDSKFWLLWGVNQKTGVLSLLVSQIDKQAHKLMSSEGVHVT